EILGQVKRLDGTVRGLLAFSKPATPKKQPLPLREFVDRISRLAGEHDLGRAIRFVQEGPAELTVPADPVLLEQVLWNLFLNAAEAMKGGGEVRVSWRTAGTAVELVVADSGGGVPPEVLPKLFRPFVTTKTAGTGLGLSLCRKILEAHGGTITISSESGRGTRVTLRLPGG
ncbi:MAG: histidine kinase, partial [Planctomycetes bacterium]|nr:histidine kinase [Planctomycetota bacterium]